MITNVTVLEWRTPDEIPQKFGNVIALVKLKNGCNMIAMTAIDSRHTISFGDAEVLEWAYFDEYQAMVCGFNKYFRQEWIDFLHENAMK